MKNSLIGSGFRFVLLLAIQIIFFKDLSIGGHASGFVYIWFLLMLPLDLSPFLGLLIGFLSGLTVDFFSQTPGIHAGASTLLMFLRPPILKLLTPRAGYDLNQYPTFFQMGWSWYLIYTWALILAHHLLAFSLEVFSREFLGLILLNSFGSTILTWVSITTIVLLTAYPKR
jgi:hypothetical protein